MLSMKVDVGINDYYQVECAQTVLGLCLSHRTHGWDCRRCSTPRRTQPRGWSMKMTLYKHPFKKTVLISMWCIGQMWRDVRLVIIWMDSHWTVGAKVSWKSTMWTCWNPLATIQPLYWGGSPLSPNLILYTQHANLGTIPRSLGIRIQVSLAIITLYSMTIVLVQENCEVGEGEIGDGVEVSGEGSGDGGGCRW